MNESDYELGRDEVSDDDDNDEGDMDESQYLERNAKQVEDLEEDEEDGEEDEDDEDEDDGESSLKLHKPSIKEKLSLVLLGALASGLAAMVTYVATHRKDEKDDRLVSFMMYMIYMMQNQNGNNNHDHYIQPNYSTEQVVEEKGSIPSEKQFLKYVKQHGRQRATNPSMNIRDQTFVLDPPRIHESWTLKKNLDGDIEDATKTDEYVR